MELSLQQQYGCQKDAQTLWDQLKQDNELKVKLNDLASLDEVSAVELSNSENVQEYTSKIEGYVNYFNPHGDSSPSMIPKSVHSYYLMQGIPGVGNDTW